MSESSHTETFSLLKYENRGTRPRLLSLNICLRIEAYGLVHLLRKRFFMRATARLPFLHENKLFSLFPVFRERQCDPGADIQGAVERERRAVQGRAVLDLSLIHI